MYLSLFSFQKRFSNLDFNVGVDTLLCYPRGLSTKGDQIICVQSFFICSQYLFEGEFSPLTNNKRLFSKIIDPSSCEVATPFQKICYPPLCYPPVMLLPPLSKNATPGYQNDKKAVAGGICENTLVNRPFF